MRLKVEAAKLGANGLFHVSMQGKDDSIFSEERVFSGIAVWVDQESTSP